MLSLMASATTPARPHLAYIDGLRGLAALYVTAHHALAECIDSGYNRTVTSRLASHAIVWLYNGEVAVQVFIVLSGYCLMIPVARAGGALRGGLGEFARRRAWRILPTYYAALGLCLLLPVLVPGLRPTDGPLRWRITRPVTTPALAAHLLMLQHLSPRWAYRIDYPMWSISIEVWLYVAFALALVPLWRRLGTAWLTTAVVCCGLGLSAWGGPAYEAIRLHYLTLFGLGMAGAAIGFGPRNAWSRRVIRGAGPGTLAGLVAFVVLRRIVPNDAWNEDLRLVFTTGLVTTAFLVWATARKEAGTSPPPVRLLEHPATAWLGRISYSLYLMHAPALALAHLAVLRLGVGPVPSFAALMIGGTAASLLAGWGLWLAVERWSLVRMDRGGKKDRPQRASKDAEEKPNRSVR